jgi:hypothetical protein
VAVALALTQHGAVGETRDQILDVLGGELERLGMLLPSPVGRTCPG